MHRLCLLPPLLAVLAFTPFAHADPIRIFLDMVPSYKNLSSCAVQPLSALVRDMWNGCGDSNAFTSYSCFCTDSYSKFGWDISTAVVSNCASDKKENASKAVGVFHEYCASGTTQLTAGTPTSSSSERKTSISIPQAKLSLPRETRAPIAK